MSARQQPTSDAAPAGSSPNWGAPILYCLLLAGAAVYRGTSWGRVSQALYFALVVVGLYSALSPRELEAVRRRRPDTLRATHYLVTGIPYVVFPLIGWVLAVPVGWRPGILVPALPWALLIGGAFVLAITRRPAAEG